MIFDVGHGAGSFDWDVCKTALDQKFAPDTISSNLHTGNSYGPVVDLATTVTKSCTSDFRLKRHWPE